MTISAAELASSPHMIEVHYLDNIDKGAQILLTWTGNMGVRAIKLFYAPASEPSIGSIPLNESGTAQIVLETQ